MQDYLYNLVTDKYRGPIASLIKIFLFILSVIYGLTVVILIFIQSLRRKHINCKVVSVGNITLGGTGKTPLVEYIARYLKQQGHKVAILTRGYRRKITNYQSPIANYETMGDEPCMLSKNLGDIPVIVDKDRVRAACQAIKGYCVDTVILDDGFQQWRISKDLEIVTVDATNPFGNRHLLPRGILREPLSSLKRTDILVLTKTNLNPDTQDLKDFLRALSPSVAIFESMHKPLGFYKIDKPDELLSPEILKGKTVILFSAIGDPEAFENLIKSLGINIGLSFRFRDHHNYTKEDLDKIVTSSKNLDSIITTEKDAVRICQMPYALCHLPIFILRMELAITKDEQEFRNRLLRLYSF